MEQWASLITDIGFPIAVTFYLLTRMEGKLEHLSAAIQQLDQTLIQWRDQK